MVDRDDGDAGVRVALESSPRQPCELLEQLFRAGPSRGTDEVRLAAAPNSFAPVSTSHCARLDSAARERHYVSVLTAVMLAGRDNRCPRFHMIEREMREEALASGLSEEDVASEDYNKVFEDAAIENVKSFEENPLAFCYAAWLTFGPTGLYKRQLLEAN